MILKNFFTILRKINYKSEFKSRLNWYYQQILKLSFMFKFLMKKEKI